jgi:anti-anti-sigma factor
VHQGERSEPARRLGGGIPAGVPAENPYARSYLLRDVLVVELRGEIDLGSARHVDPHLEAAAQRPSPSLVVLDLGPLDFIDCFGLSLLVRARRRIADRGGRVRMAVAHLPTRKLLAMTGLNGVFQPEWTLEDALAP